MASTPKHHAPALAPASVATPLLSLTSRCIYAWMRSALRGGFCPLSVVGSLLALHLPFPLGGRCTGRRREGLCLPRTAVPVRWAVRGEARRQDEVVARVPSAESMSSWGAAELVAWQLGLPRCTSTLHVSVTLCTTGRHCTRLCFLGSFGVSGTSADEGDWDGAGAGAGGRARSRNRRESRSRGKGGPPATAAAPATATATVTTTATATAGYRNARAGRPHPAFGFNSRRGVRGLPPAVEAVGALRDCES